MNEQRGRKLKDWVGHRLVGAVALAAMALGVGSPAYAEISLSIQSGSDSLSCSDVPLTTFPSCSGSATSIFGDLDPDLDDITMFANGFGDWNSIQVNASGVTTFLGIQEISVAAESNVSSDLTVSFTQTGLTGSSLSAMVNTWFDASLVGSDDGSDSNTGIDYLLYADSTNVAFGTEQELISFEDITGLLGDSDRIGSSVATFSGPFSITQVFNISHGLGGTRTTSFTSAVQTVPEPAVVGLIGLGLVLVALRRRKV